MKIIGIIAGKGGVGKSVITGSMAVDLQKKGMRIGIIDADIYGPSIKQLLGAATYPATNIEGKIEPAYGQGIFYISLAFFQRDHSTTAVRAPIANDIIMQFLNMVNWNGLDYLFIDFPPGTGDIPLTLIQQTCLSVVVVTTPGIISQLDVEKAIVMCQQCDVPIIGIVENMSYIAINNKKHFVFGESAGKILSEKFTIPFLGEIPLSMEVGNSLGNGNTIAEITEENFISAVADITEQIDMRSGRKEEERRGLQPSHISIVNSCRLSIVWKDGLEQEIPINQIQQYCPCQQCRDSDIVVHTGVEATQVRPVGHYAACIAFTSGCSMGIYPYHLLREIGGKSHD